MVRIAVSVVSADGLNSAVSPHFGRCPYFVVVDVEDREVTAVRTLSNPYYSQHQPGQVPSFIREQRVDVMLTAGMGRRAVALFEQYGIQTATGASDTVRRALDQYLAGELEGAKPCHESVQHAYGESGLGHEHDGEGHT